MPIGEIIRDPVQPMPRESFPPPPRNVRRRRGPAILHRILSVGGLFVLAILILMAVNDTLVRLAGKPVTATINRKWVSTSKHDRYRVAYRYTLDNLSEAGEEAIPQGLYEKLSEGGSTDARAMRLFGFRRSAISIGAAAYAKSALIWLLVFAVAAYLIYDAFHDAWIIPVRDKNALRFGDITTGQVIHTFSTWNKRRDRHWMKFQFTTPQPDGAIKTCTREMRVRDEDIARYRGGDGLTVFYDPRRPTFGVAYEVCDFEITNG